MELNYDLIVIGAGPGGYVSAIRAAQEGMKVALIESREVGGTCLNRGCIPTKTLIHASHLYREMRSSEKIGIFSGGLSFDIEKIYNRKDEVVGQLRSGIESLIKSNKIDMINGIGKITGNHEVTVASDDEIRILETKKILIASGSVPTVPAIEGIDLAGVITSDEMIQQSGTEYKNLVIIGGGVIGVEFATVFSSLDCQVTMIEAMDRILPTMDREISQNLNMILKKRGVSIHAGAKVERLEQNDKGLVCHFNQKGSEKIVEAEAVLVAIGRTANLKDLFGDGVHVKTDRGILVNEHFQTDIPDIYAIGDAIHGSVQLAHVASAQGCNAVAHMIGTSNKTNLDVIPSCIYTDPEIATVGITADQAKKDGIQVKTGKFNMGANGKSIIESQERGFIKVVFDAESEVLLGAQLMCARATDLISELSTAISNKLTVKQLSSVIRPHPTFTEGVTEAVEDVEGCGIHVIKKR